MKLLPDSVTVLPAYATAGSAELTVGLALMSSNAAMLVALVADGFEKFTLKSQLPALSDADETTKSLVLPKIEQLDAATPQTAAEQFWLLAIKLLPVKVNALPAYADTGSTEPIDGDPITVRTPSALVAAALEGLLIETLTTQLPATADADSTTTTLPVDATLHEETAREHTVALQL